MKIRSIIILFIVIGGDFYCCFFFTFLFLCNQTIKTIVLEIASNSSVTRKRRTRCCGKNLFRTIFKKFSRRSSKKAPVLHTNLVKLSEKVDQHSLSSWLSGTKPASSISFVNNNIYIDPYDESVLFVDSSRLSGLMGSLDISENNENAKWGQRVDHFAEKDSRSSPHQNYVKKKRRIPKIKSNYFNRLQQSYVPSSDSYIRALELSNRDSRLPSRKLKYPYGCYTYSRQLFQPECDSQYDVPLVNHELAGYYNEEPFSPEKIRTFKIFVNLEKGNRVPAGFSQLM